MAYVITQNCCKDGSCIPVCPVDCIRPAAAAGEFTATEQLYIDPETCIDCGACMEECPVDAIHYEDDLPVELARFTDINAAYFRRHPLEPGAVPAPRPHPPVPAGALRVAIVGAGPAACYAAAELVAVDGVEVNVFERLPTPFGLIRAGVAPDHQHTKSVVGAFEHAFSGPRVACYLNVQVGEQLHHDELMAHHHAVIYAVGAADSRALGIPGETLPGSHPAAEFVGWYNGHPDHAGHRFDLAGRRAVIVGNGNVALDVARVLLMGPDALATTDVAAHALTALAHSSIDEVVILGRRGIRDSAFSVGEFLALGHLPGVDVVLDGADLTAGLDDDVETTVKLDLAREYAQRAPTPGHKRIVFRFLVSPSEIVGSERVEGLRVVAGDDAEPELIETALVLRSIGYRGAAIPGLPHDHGRGVVPNADGRVLGADGAPVPGVYVTGWIKRGPRGVIGTNRTCAEQTVAALLADFDDGTLTRALPDPAELSQLLTRRGARPLTWRDWQNIDRSERRRGAELSRPRLKFVSVPEVLALADADSA
ncbi:FAD-dependent oxidoreductase [Mycobacterium talmoniae]|uniref:ferredoxin--NADP(+) reductase n=1 Tax=Mycobacterium talmoniae TaxID=1858794 RepID=A0A1S1NFU3_9MYCO|nr:MULTISPECIES: FAD-dependent oxidoreductase [Mycobacterium]OHV02523.1 ferredoxin [Mycobacterium talmoniae]TDH56003.1 4Fe-4S dicluster domain-containing protein [Mycobacterium eburneum]